MVKGYYLVESRNIMEHDSPVRGCTSDLVTEKLIFGPFQKEHAYGFLGLLKQEHQSYNETLKFIANYYNCRSLVGEQVHSFAHELQISYKVKPVEIKDKKDIITDSKGRYLKDFLIDRFFEGELPFHLVEPDFDDLQFGHLGDLRVWPEETYQEHIEGLLNVSLLMGLEKVPRSFSKKLPEVFSTPEDAYKWLMVPIKELDGKSPFSYIQQRNYQTLENLLEKMKKGVC